MRCRGRVDKDCGDKKIASRGCSCVTSYSDMVCRIGHCRVQTSTALPGPRHTIALGWTTTHEQTLFFSPPPPPPFPPTRRTHPRSALASHSKARTSLQAAHTQKHTHTRVRTCTLVLELPLLKVKTLCRSRQGCFAWFVILYIHIIIFFFFTFAILLRVCRVAQAHALTMAFQCWCRPTGQPGTQTLGRRRARDRDWDQDHGQYMTSVADRGPETRQTWRRFPVFLAMYPVRRARLAWD